MVVEVSEPGYCDAGGGGVVVAAAGGGGGHGRARGDGRSPRTDAMQHALLCSSGRRMARKGSEGKARQGGLP